MATGFCFGEVWQDSNIMVSSQVDLNGENHVPAPSRAIRDVRIAQGLSLRALSARAGLPYSTLSKLENGKMSLTYDKLIRLAQALNVDLKDILASPQEKAAPIPVGRRSVTRAGEALDADSEKHVHHYPAADLLGKMMIPIIIDVQARSVDELGGLVRHGGEEYLYVLRGSMELY
jgi:transcriptional regulator with XRE-family HTH domain